jgi:hypothetical protein
LKFREQDTTVGTIKLLLSPFIFGYRTDFGATFVYRKNIIAIFTPFVLTKPTAKMPISEGIKTRWAREFAAAEEKRLAAGAKNNPSTADNTPSTVKKTAPPVDNTPPSKKHVAKVKASDTDIDIDTNIDINVQKPSKKHKTKAVAEAVDTKSGVAGVAGVAGGAEPPHGHVREGYTYDATYKSYLPPYGNEALKTDNTPWICHRCYKQEFTRDKFFVKPDTDTRHGNRNNCASCLLWALKKGTWKVALPWEEKASKAGNK